jgi:glucokinase
MKKRYLLIDAGGTRIKLGLMVDGRLVRQDSIPARSEKGILPGLEHIVALFEAWLEGAPCDGIGLAFAGIVEHAENRVLSVNGKFNDAVGFDFSAWASRHFGCPLSMENDARAATIGEWKHGSGKGVDDMVMLTLGTGIGSSAIIGGQALRGRHSQAGCLMGHFTIDRDGGRCNCGNIGCAESVASGWALPEIIRTSKGYADSAFRDEQTLDFETLFRLAELGDQVAVTVREQCLRGWAMTAVNAIHAYDPEVLVIGGGVMQSGAIIRDQIQAHVNEYAWTPWGKVQVRLAALGNQAAFWGMSHLLETGAGATDARFEKTIAPAKTKSE